MTLTDIYLRDFQSFVVNNHVFERKHTGSQLDEGCYRAVADGYLIGVLSGVRRGGIVPRIVEWFWGVVIGTRTYRYGLGFGLPREAAQDAMRFLSKYLAGTVPPVVP